MRKFLLIFLAAFTAGCGFNEKPDRIPAYIQVNDISVNVSSGQGTASDNISDVWLYYEDPEIGYTLQGAYEMPASFPILTEGQTNKRSNQRRRAYIGAQYIAPVISVL